MVESIERISRISWSAIWTGACVSSDGDSIQILPGITVFTGARHTYASQYVLIDGESRFILASDNAYLYRNIAEGRRSATFSADDAGANREALRRMVMLAGDSSRVIPGHDAEVFRRYPVVADGIVRISR